MKAIVTGGAGFIGSHLVEALIFSGAKVHVIDNLSTGHLEYVHPKSFLHVMDIGSEEIKELIIREQPDIVFHMAAQVDVQRSVREPEYDASVNIVGTVNLLDACCKASIKKFVYASSCAVYGDLNVERIQEEHPTCPISYYGISKLTPEHYIRVFHQLYGLPYTILRYANVYGPRQTPKGEGGVVAIFLDRIKRGLPLLIHGDGEQTRDFVYVKDVVTANLAAIQKGHSKILHVSTAARTSVNQLVDIVRKIHRSDVPVIHEPERPADIKHSCLDNNKSIRDLDWEPQYHLESGLKEAYSFVMQK